MTGWTQNEAEGVSLEKVFQIVHPYDSPNGRESHRSGVAGRRDRRTVERTLLISKDGTERPIGPVDDSAAPIRNDQGELSGVLLVFRDISELIRKEQHLQDALTYADNIIATMREPFLVLDKGLRVKTANRAFYQTFDTNKEETETRFIYDLGNGQWNISRLRTLLGQVLSDCHPVHDFEMEHVFPAIGKKVMLLDAAVPSR